MTRAGVRAVESKRVLVENPSYLLRPRRDAGLAIADVAHRETTATAKRAAHARACGYTGRSAQINASSVSGSEDDGYPRLF